MLRYIYRPQRSWGKVIFSEACVNNSVHGGHAWLLGGHAWLHRGGACVVLFRGVCMVLFGGGGGMHGFIWGDMCGFIRGCAWFYLGSVWFYSGGMRGFIQGRRAWFFQFFLDTMRYGQ